MWLMRCILPLLMPLHADQAILCLNHKKHVLCEKPLASNVKEVEAMIEAAKGESGCINGGDENNIVS